MPPDRRHTHEYSPFPSMFGKFGRQSVHYHACVRVGCDAVLVAESRESCDGKRSSHWLEFLGAGDADD